MRVVRDLPREWRKIDRRYLYRSLKEFHHNRLIDWQETTEGVITATLTENGRQMILRFNPDNMTIPIPAKWNRVWHLVIYDIPHSKKAARDALRRKLRELGFFEWQKSVFIYPYPCREQIDFIIEFFDIRPYVRQADIINPTNEAELLLHFGLK
jgi:DNA-binding transcriptional regulator PaaX